MIKIVISGISGRMGMRIAAIASQSRDLEIAGAVEASSSQAIGRDIGELIGSDKTGKKVEADFKKIASSCDVLIEFTSPLATLEHLEDVVATKSRMVIGTTGFSKDDIEKIKVASKKVAIVFSPNMSIGANLLFKIAEDTASALGKNYEAEIVETHHNQKKDAPSGTAKRLAESVFNATGKTPPMHSIRLGDIVGDHTVIFAGNGERIELTHRAHSRDALARGALDAARFLMNKKPGLYSMRDVIGV